MGCCHSVPEERVQNNINTNNNNVPVATIAVSKTPSITYRNDAEPSHAVDSLPPSIGEPFHVTTESEKVPVATTEPEPDHSTLKSDIPPITITITTTTPEPDLEPEPPKTPALIVAEIEQEGEEEKQVNNYNNTKSENEQREQGKRSWSVTVRLSNTGKDTNIPIPTEAPFMTITELRQHIQPCLNPGQQVRLIHLGRILKDQSTLVPSTNLLKSSDEIVPVSNQGVIQAMAYHPPSI